MAGRDMEARSRGSREMVSTDDHVRARIGQVEYLGDLLIKGGVPIVLPIGGHGVFVDAGAVLSHIPQADFPAHALPAAVSLDSGVRGMERGIVSAGRDAATGENHQPKLELLRLAIPRRVYTQSHMDVVAESIIDAYRQREQIGGPRFTYAPP